MRRLRAKARFIDEMHDSASVVEKAVAAATHRLADLDRTLADRRRHLDSLLRLAGGPGCTADSPHGRVRRPSGRSVPGGRRGCAAVALPSVATGAAAPRWLTPPPAPPSASLQELLAQAEAETGGRHPASVPGASADLASVQRDAEFWRERIATEREGLTRQLDSLKYVNACLAKARTDLAALQARRASLDAAKRWRPNVRRT